MKVLCPHPLSSQTLFYLTIKCISNHCVIALFDTNEFLLSNSLIMITVLSVHIIGSQETSEYILI